jgi:hypothetical protein
VAFVVLIYDSKDNKGDKTFHDIHLEPFKGKRQKKED